MTKTKTLKAITIDGTVLKRRTARNYSHMIARFNKYNKTWDSITWIGRPDLIISRINYYYSNAKYSVGLIKESEYYNIYLIEVEP
tara:strand:+ start:243 stop:497 length:255 start_codon:yes stop_codon:yes gene_type:complete